MELMGEEAAAAVPTSSKTKTAGKDSAAKKLTPAQKKKATKIQAHTEVLKATGQFNPLATSATCVHV